MRVFLLLLVVASILAAGDGLAAANDLRLRGLVDTSGETPKPDDEQFRLLVRELGLVMTPTSLQLAETTGQAGFDFGLDYAFHAMRFDEPYWQRTREDPTFPLLMTLGVRARKGFVLPVPLASELEVGAQWLIDSSLLNLGANMRVALNEGFRWIPDVAVQVGINRMVGSTELDLFTVTAGGQISKGFGIQGSINLAPFVGYQSVWVNGVSHLVDADPTDTSNVDDNVVFALVPLTETRVDRVSAGARLVVAIVHVTAGVDMNFFDGVALLQYGVRAGVAF